MDGKDFLRGLAENPPQGAYYFCGTEPYSLNKAVQALSARANPDLADMNVLRLKGVNAETVINAAETLPFFDEKRFLFVSDFDADTANALAEYASNVPESTVLVLIRHGEPPKKNALYLALEKVGRTVIFSPLGESGAADFVEKRARQNGVSMERPVANLIVRRVGTDLGGLENALHMLAAYVGYGNPVTREAVETCVRASDEYNVFRIMDCFWAGNKRDGLSTLMGLLRDPSESALGLATLFERNVRGVLEAKQLLTSGLAERAAIEAIGGNEYVAKKAIRNAKEHSLEELTTLLEDFAAVERLQKQGLMRAEDALVSAFSRNF